MSEIVHTGPCPTCHQPVYRAKQCTCDHAVSAHAFGTRRGQSVRTYCNVYECDCKTFKEALNDTAIDAR